MPVALTCTHCAAPYSVKPSQAKESRYCSRACKGADRANWTGERAPNFRGGLLSKTCETCGVGFKTRPYKRDTARFCSRACQHVGHSEEMKGRPGNPGLKGESSPRWKGGPPEWVCEECGASYRRAVDPRARSRFCTTQCKNQWLGREKTRETPPEIRIPLAKVRRWLRNSLEYREWRAAVYKRDGHACVKCGTVERLTAHHVKQIVRHPELAFDVENGLTVCDPCHKAIHSVEGTARGTARLVAWMLERGWKIGSDERPLYEHTCDTCARAFKSRLARQIRCSPKCNSKHWNAIYNARRKAAATA